MGRDQLQTWLELFFLRRRPPQTRRASCKFFWRRRRSARGARTRSNNSRFSPTAGLVCLWFCRCAGAEISDCSRSFDSIPVKKPTLRFIIANCSFLLRALLRYAKLRRLHLREQMPQPADIKQFENHLTHLACLPLDNLRNRKLNLGKLNL